MENNTRPPKCIFWFIPVITACLVYEVCFQFTVHDGSDFKVKTVGESSGACSNRCCPEVDNKSFFLTAGNEDVFQDRQLVCLSFCVLQSCSLTITEWHKCRHLSGVLVERHQEMLQEIYFLSSLMGALCSLCHGCVVMILTSHVSPTILVVHWRIMLRSLSVTRVFVLHPPQ